MSSTVADTKAPSSVAVVAAATEQKTVERPGRRLGVAFWIAVTWLVLVVGSTVIANLNNWKKPTDFLGAAEVSDGKFIQSISWSHPLGLDLGGNDVLVNLVVGAKNSLVIALFTVLFGFLVGGTLGMIAGYFRGAVDTVLSFINNVLLSLPALLFILLLIAVISGDEDSAGLATGLQSSVGKVSLALGILSIPTLFRVVRASTISFSQREFVMASRAMGSKTPRILLSDILPNVAKPMLAFGLVAAGTVMVIEGGLSFLGVGVGAGTDVTAWGKQIQAASQRADLEKAPYVALIPGLALFFTVLAFNYIGDKIRERLEVKQAAL
jgi:peptide/nickel transport system permease protein